MKFTSLYDWFEVLTLTSWDFCCFLLWDSRGDFTIRLRWDLALGPMCDLDLWLPWYLGLEFPLGSYFWNHVGSCFGTPVGSCFGTLVGSYFWPPVGSHFGAPVKSHIGTPVGFFFGTRVGSCCWTPMGSYFGIPVGSYFVTSVFLSTHSYGVYFDSHMFYFQNPVGFYLLPLVGFTLGLPWIFTEGLTKFLLFKLPGGSL